jgi:hypothetical protein
MSDLEQFRKVVTEAGAEAARIERRASGAERLIIRTPGGLITREIPLKGDLDKDIQDATSAARQIECRDGRPIPARTAACRGFGRIFVIAAAGSVGVGAVPANPDPHDGLNVDTAAFRATHVEKVGHG